MKRVRYKPEDLRVSTIKPGFPGSGKSSSVIDPIAQVIGDDLATVIIMDGTHKLGRDVALKLGAKGRGSRVDYDRLAHFVRILGGLSPVQSIEADYFRRESQNAMLVKGMQDVAWSAARRVEEDGKTIHSMPSLQLASEYGFRNILFQRDPARRNFSRVPYLTRVGHREWHDIVAGSADEEAREWYRDLLPLQRGNPRLLEERIGAFHRLIKQAFAPQLRERLAGRSHLEEALLSDRKRCIILDGGNDGTLSRQAVTSLFRAWNLHLYQTLLRLYTLHQRPHHVIVVWEEMAAYNLLGDSEIEMMREGRKLGFHPWGLTQDFAFMSPATREAMLKLFRRKEWFNPGDAEMGLVAAEDLAYRQLDPLLIHSIEEGERQIREDRPRVETERTRTTMKDHAGRERTGEAVRDREIYDYRTVKETRTKYVDLGDQIKLKVTELLGMGPGERQISHVSEGKTYVSTGPEYAPMPEDDFPEEDFPGLAAKKLARLIEASQKADYFHSPQPPEPPCETTETPPPPAPAGPKKPARKPNANPKGTEKPRPKDSPGRRRGRS